MHAHGRATGYLVTTRGTTDYVATAESIDTDVYDAAISVSSRYHIRRFAYLQSLKVDKDHRRSGIGGLLLETFIAVAAKYDMQVVSLFANPDRTRNYNRLERFYLRHGFTSPIKCRSEFERVVGAEKRLKRSDAITLNKRYMEERKRRHAK
jgi:GNAT superfamily N-acetyltransferase